MYCLQIVGYFDALTTNLVAHDSLRSVPTGHLKDSMGSPRTRVQSIFRR